MTQLATLSAARPERLQLVTYEAFKIAPTGAGYSNTPEARRWMAGTGTRLASDSLDAALAEALVVLPLMHKDMLAIREDTTEGAPLFLYQVKRKSQPRWVHKDHVTRAVHDLYAAPVCMLPAEVLGAATSEQRRLP